MAFPNGHSWPAVFEQLLHLMENNDRLESMALTDTPLERSLLGLYEAADLAQLREQLSRHLVDRGFWGVTEHINCLRVTKSYRDPGKYIWDDLSNHVGDRRSDLIDALFSACLSQGIEEENRRLRWVAAQKRPYFAFSRGAVSFKVHREIYQAVRDFGLRATNTLVVPLPDGGAGRHRLWAHSETGATRRNAQEAAGLMMAYNHMRQLLPTEETHSGRHPTTTGHTAPVGPGRDPMHGPVPASRTSALVLAEGYPTRKEAVRAYIEDHLHNPELGGDQLCRVFAMSRRTIYRMFADEGGVARYLTERRLARAFDELNAASPSRGLIYDVAERHGFVDQNHFSRLFRKRFHIAPSDAVSLRPAHLAPASPRSRSTA